MSVWEKTVTVCGVCETAACFHGVFMCDYAETAGLKYLTVRDLHDKPRGENPEYWFKSSDDGTIDRDLLGVYQKLAAESPRILTIVR